MADGELCIKCGYQETAHKYPMYAEEGHPPCGDFDNGEVDPATLPPSNPCSHYPHCPDTEDTVQVGVTEYDSESDSYFASYRDETLTGPCCGRCRAREQEELEQKPLSHAVWTLFYDPATKQTFLADIGC